MPRLNQSELWFQRYLRDHGYRGADEHEPDLGISRRPDFLVSKGKTSAACEVKQFDSPSPLDRKAELMSAAPGRPQPFTAGDGEVYGPMRSQVHDAARQMRELRDRDLPLVAVLVNPRGRWVNLSVHFALPALYGNPTVGGPYNRSTGAIDALARVGGRDGELTNDHGYLSAVVLLRRHDRTQDAINQWLADNRARLGAEYADPDRRAVAALTGLNALVLPGGDYFSVDVIHTTSAQLGHARMLHDDMFDGPNDRHWLAADGGANRNVWFQRL